MLNIANAAAIPTFTRAPAARSAAIVNTDPDSSRHIAYTLAMLNDALAPQRRVVHAGDVIYQSGERFGTLYVLNSGFFKIVNLSADGREQVVGLKFRGDWLGFDGIARRQYSCDAIAMDTGEIWAIPYETLMAACADQASLLTVLHEAMSREIAHDRDIADVGVHLARRCACRRLPPILGRLSRRPGNAHRPVHFAHDAGRDR